MKLSDVPTGFIIAKATTNSEWDSCDFAIIHFCNSEFIKEIIEEYNKLYDKYRYAILNIRISADNAEFFIQDESHGPEEINSFLDSKKDWSYIDITQEEIESFTRPENEIRYGQIKVSGTIQYVAYGKHTDEEFWIDGIPVEELFKTETIGG